MNTEKEVCTLTNLARQLELGGYLLDKPDLASLDVLKNLLTRETEGTEAYRLLADMLKILREQSSDLTEIQVEYAKLFVGPFAMLAPPYAGLYLSGEKCVHGVIAKKLTAIYAANGLTKNPRHKTLPDYAATELEFLYYLAYLYLKTGDHAYLRRYQEFYELYVNSWCERWLKDVETHAQTRYYQLFAAYLRLFVRRAGMFYVA